MDRFPAVILENSAYFTAGQVLEDYEIVDDGLLFEDKFVPGNNYVLLNEHLTLADEKRIKDLIRQQLKLLFWNLYTKQSIMVGNL